ncbi:trichohyalin-like isoform X2 [Carassius auratus]|uniref:Trichohyalin-like isoform X2 n=1 Tax=Carassius auratus TaxID=7957 RepID=A0A6P6JQV9_CARAU|nr:trichohyalin-like isoform X2 [Carassius auratus]
MNYSRRVAIWLLALSVQIIQACAYCGRLEMISVWLLFLKLLRATAGVRRSYESELNDGKTTSVNQQQKEQEYLSETVTMETSQLSEMADLTDCKMDPGFTEDQPCQFTEEVNECVVTYFSECLDTKQTNPQEDLCGQENIAITNECDSSGESDESKDSQEGILVKVNEQDDPNSRVSLAFESNEVSIVNDKPEEEMKIKNSDNAQKEDHDEPKERVEAQDNSVLEGQEGSVLEIQEESVLEAQEECVLEEQVSVLEAQEESVLEEQVSVLEAQEESVLEEQVSVLEAQEESVLEEQEQSVLEEQEHSVLEAQEETELEEREESVLELQEESVLVKRDESVLEAQKGTELEVRGESLLKAQEETELEEQEESMLKAQEQTVLEEQEESVLEKQEETVLEEQEESVLEKQEETELEEREESVLEKQEETELEEREESVLEAQEKAVLEQQINELVISVVPSESCPDMDRDDLSDCLLVEMAIISSDSDAEEPWRSLAVDKEDIEENGDLLGMDEAVNSEDQARQEDNEVINSNAELEEVALALNINESDILEQPECPTECELQDISLESSSQYCSLTKIAEDEEELGKTSKHNLQRLSCSTSELDKKLPKDFCVVQEIKSENVSTEHLDFRVARKQWQKMEEQTKGLVHRPVMRQTFCQGGHSFMYTPVRNIDRPRRDPDIETLGLGDYQYTQFSPCSEDSGLDDTSYRSPYDEPETPVEREIREALEREENFRREREMAKMSVGDTVQVKPRPGVLHQSRSEPGDKGRIFDTPEDRSRSQRSPSAKTPTLSVTGTSGKSPSYHEMIANNVIILDPDSYPTSPQSRGKGGMLSPGTSSFHEWPSDMNNVIILETSNLIIRSASEFCLSSACQETQESTFQNNPFFKLRSHSTQSLVDQEIKLVKQREEELRRQRAQLYVKERYDTVLVSPNQLQNSTYEKPGVVPAKSKSSPSSPSKSRKMDRSALSCDHKCIFLFFIRTCLTSH